MKYLVTCFVATLLLAFTAAAQDNLVKNPDFEAAGDMNLLKKPGMIDLCDDWIAANEVMPDYYSADAKSDKVGVPKNDNGEQSASSGDRYAGFRTYSKDSKKDRSYLQVSFTKPLVKNKKYCIQFNVSLSESSKFASNHVSAFVSRSRVRQGDMAEIIKDAQVMTKSNPVIAQMDGWETVCNTYTATGGETTLVLGSFVRDDQIKTVKMSKPAGRVEPQTYHAYYYVDDVSVVEVASPAQCACNDDGPKEEIIYSKTIPITENMSLGEVLKASTVYFPSLAANLSPIGKRDLNSAIERLKANPAVRIELVGHSDNDEMEEAKVKTKYVGIALRRAESVKAYLVSQGIEEGRIRVASKDNAEPANTRPTPLSKAQNRRVAIRVM